MQALPAARGVVGLEFHLQRLIAAPDLSQEKRIHQLCRLNNLCQRLAIVGREMRDIRHQNRGREAANLFGKFRITNDVLTLPSLAARYRQCKTQHQRKRYRLPKFHEYPLSNFHHWRHGALGGKVISTYLRASVVQGTLTNSAGSSRSLRMSQNATPPLSAQTIQQLLPRLGRRS